MRQLQFVTRQHRHPFETAADMNQFIERIDRIGVKRVRLTGPDDLDGALVPAEQLFETLEVELEQARTLVFGETPRPDDREHVRVEHFPRLVGDDVEQHTLEMFLARRQCVVLVAFEST